MAKPDGDDWSGPLAVVITALCLGAVWAFSRFFNLDMATGFGVLLSLLVLAGVVFGCSKWGDDFPFLHPRKSWPLLLALFVMCWWPALDVWARQQSPRLWANDAVELWWNAWYTKLAVLLAGVAGYVVNLWRGD